MDRISQFEKLLASGQDTALLRFSLGNAYGSAGHWSEAIRHLQRAVAMDAGYSAAWKLLGKALTQTGQVPEAMEAYQQGIQAAEQRGDIQAAKEMRVFLKRLQRAN